MAAIASSSTRKSTECRANSFPAIGEGSLSKAMPLARLLVRDEQAGRRRVWASLPAIRHWENAARNSPWLGGISSHVPAASAGLLGE